MGGMWGQYILSHNPVANSCSVVYSPGMQTFLPYAKFAQSAEVLDRARLGKQRIEAKQIVQTLERVTTGATKGVGWRNHPAVKMWAGHEGSLCRYAIAICLEWRQRGYRDSQLPWFRERLVRYSTRVPKWLGDPRVHASHRANLIRKAPGHYSRFGWVESPRAGYFWPV